MMPNACGMRSRRSTTRRALPPRLKSRWSRLPARWRIVLKESTFARRAGLPAASRIVDAGSTRFRLCTGTHGDQPLCVRSARCGRDTGNAGAAQPLPILVFDERRLTPSFGYVFKRQWLDPHESIVSILWKFAPDERPLGSRGWPRRVAMTTIDPYDGIEPTRGHGRYPAPESGAGPAAQNSCGPRSFRAPWSISAAAISATVRGAWSVVITAFCISWSPCSCVPCTAVGCKQTVGTATSRRRIDSMRVCWIRRFAAAIVASFTRTARPRWNLGKPSRAARW